MKHIQLLLLSLICTFTPSVAAIQLPTIFADSMALQQSATVAIWGQTSANQPVVLTTSWSKQHYTTTADAKGYFRCHLSTPAYRDVPYGNITIQAGKDKKHIRHILFAEVWLASGQSNMEMPVQGWEGQPCFGAHEAITRAGQGLPMRFYMIPKTTNAQPQWQGQGTWRTIAPDNVGEVSACAYYFAQEISQSLQTPVAIVHCVWEGTNIQPWMNPEAFALVGETIDPLPDQPHKKLPCAIYNSMVKPIVGFTIQGMIWYQGESNRNNPQQYLRLFPVMVSEWRRIWQQGEFPFFYVQIAPYGRYKGMEGPLVREVQEQASRVIPNSGMAVLIDLGDSLCIHPPYKKEAGQRLAYHALNKTYGMHALPCESPKLDSIRIQHDTVYITFRDAPLGVAQIGAAQSNMQLAGADHIWYPATAHVSKRGDLYVLSDKVPQPVAVRYCYSNYSIGNLFAPSGLPVAPFRSDNW